MYGSSFTLKKSLLFNLSFFMPLPVFHTIRLNLHVQNTCVGLGGSVRESRVPLVECSFDGYRSFHRELNRTVFLHDFENRNTGRSLGSRAIRQEQQTCTDQNFAKDIHSLFHLLMVACQCRRTGTPLR